MDEHTLIYVHTDNGKIVDDCGNNWTTIGSPIVTNDGIKFEKEDHLSLDGEFTIGGSDFTIDFWTNYSLESDSYGRMFAFFNGQETGGRFFSMYQGDREDILYFCDYDDQYNTRLQFAGKMNHFAFVYQHEAQKITIFINGKKLYSLSRNIPLRTYQNLYINGSTRSDREAIQTLNKFRISNIARWKSGFDNVDGTSVLWHFKYKNKGTADSLIVRGTTVTTEHSKYGTAFYQTHQQRCFDIPSTNEIWAKFDIYGSSTWRAFNNEIQRYDESSNGLMYSGSLKAYSNNNSINSSSITNTLNTVLLHMVSGSLLEYWVNGVKIYTYTGNVNNGYAFSNFFLASNGSGALFSNVIISDQKIGLDEDANSVEFNIDADTERNVESPFREFIIDADTERTVENPIVGRFAIDADSARNSVMDYAFDGDTEITIENDRFKVFIGDFDTKKFVSNNVISQFDTGRTVIYVDKKPFTLNCDSRVDVIAVIEDDYDSVRVSYQGRLAFADNNDTILRCAAYETIDGDTNTKVIHKGGINADTKYMSKVGIAINADTDISKQNDRFSVASANFDTYVDIYKAVTQEYGLALCKTVDLGASYKVECAINIVGTGYALISYGNELDDMTPFVEYTPRSITARYIVVKIAVKGSVSAATLQVIPVPQEITVSKEIPVNGTTVSYGVKFFKLPMIFPASNEYSVKISKVTDSNCFVELLNGTKSVAGNVSLLVKG